MRKILLDSGILSQYVAKRSPVFERLLEYAQRGDRLGTATPVLAEYYYGLEMSQTKDQNLVRLERTLLTLRIWAFDTDSAKNYGLITANLRRIGRPMQSIDVMIGAIALTIGDCTVVTTDSDLESIPGVTVENWK
jgi:tRNA(fMet)-specific endonuclease VapC